MKTNKYAGTCTVCNERVSPGNGTLYQEWDNQADDVVWKVRHSDGGICQSIEQDKKHIAQCGQAYDTILAYIKEFADHRPEAIYGNDVLIDQRKGYNFVGWVITADGDNTIYLTSHSNLDGHEFSETYILTDVDDGFGNGNNDIRAALQNINNDIMVNTKPFIFS